FALIRSPADLGGKLVGRFTIPDIKEPAADIETVDRHAIRCAKLENDFSRFCILSRQEALRLLGHVSNVIRAPGELLDALWRNWNRSSLLGNSGAVDQVVHPGGERGQRARVHLKARCNH